MSANVSAEGPAEKTPDFNFFRLNKNSITNKDLEERKKLFFVFFDSDCDHCQHAIPFISQQYREFKKTAIYLITLDNREEIARFMGKYGNGSKDKKNFTLLQDPNYQFVLKFGPGKYPSILLDSAKKELIMYDDNETNLLRFSQEINKVVT